MNADNNRFRDYLNVTLWHSKGYTGTRGLSASAEPFDDGHGGKVEEVFHEIAPDRKLISIVKQGAVDDNFNDDIVVEIATKKVDTFTSSLARDMTGAAFERVKDLCTVFNAAGNDDSRDYAQIIESPYVYGVGALYLSPDNKPSSTWYTSETEHVDFASFARVSNFEGTSCATPVLCGMAALVNDYFIDKTGRPLSSEAMYRFLKDNSYDINDPGKDVKTGWGVVRLPDPDTIDIWKYQKKEEEPVVETTVTKTGVPIIETDWDWAYSLSKRNATTELIIHHAAGNGSAEQIHNLHLDKGWTGIAYNYYVRKDGKIYRGRPEDAIGGHSSGNYNQISIGICFEGNFQTDIMGEAQFNAGSMLVADILSRYPNLKVLRHGDINSTACPGKNFPFEEMTENMTGKEIYEKLSIYLAELDESPWSQDEGTWRKAIDAGVVDGTNPRGYITREQMTALLGRLNLI